ncbi:hypothetical protein [Paenibacillus sp. FSL R7-0652]|uniref:Uncharacterized protein n=1 Tax=Paenibacillus sp. AN1007 TaxID=3151385 RepID=A0AAU8N7C2_9BACL
MFYTYGIIYSRRLSCKTKDCIIHADALQRIMPNNRSPALHQGPAVGNGMTAYERLLRIDPAILQ